MSELFFISQQEVNFLIMIGLAIFSGYIIGIERESRGKDAGISTHMMVIVGAMTFTFLSAAVDPMSQSRIAAQIVSGIGFLGAGLILKEGKNVKNLTTAASIWATGAIGMMIGYQFYVLALTLAIAVTIIPRLPHIHPNSPEAVANAWREQHRWLKSKISKIKLKRRFGRSFFKKRRRCL